MLLPADLIERAQRHDEAAIEALIASAWPFAYRLAYAITANPSCAQDAAQDACVIVYRTIGTLRRTDAFRTWFYRIVVREAKRAVKHAQTVELQERGYLQDTTEHLDVWRALDALPRFLRNIVVLRYFEDLTSREIATILRIPDGTVRFQLMLARKQLRPLLHVSDDTATHVSGKVQTHVV